MGCTRENAELILASSMFPHVSCPLIVTPTPRLLLLLGQWSAPKYRDAVRAQTYAKILTCLAPIIPWALYLSPVTQVVHARCRFVV